MMRTLRVYSLSFLVYHTAVLAIIMLYITSPLLLLLLSRFSRVRLCATPQTAAHQAPPSLELTYLLTSSSSLLTIFFQIPFLPASTADNHSSDLFSMIFSLSLFLILHVSKITEYLPFSVCLFHFTQCLQVPSVPSQQSCFLFLQLNKWASIQLKRRRHWYPTPALLPGKSHGRWSLVGCSPWGLEESDRTERLHFHFSLSCIGEGNGNPLQYSCLENPIDKKAWRATVHGIAESRIRLSDQHTNIPMFIFTTVSLSLHPWMDTFLQKQNCQIIWQF